MPVSAATAVLVAVGLDAAFGEPPARVHPVALFGRLVGRIERAISSGSVDRPGRARLAGALVALVLPLGFAGVAAGVVGVGTRIDPWIGAALAGLALFSTTSLRLLITSARGVIDATETDLDRARHDLRALAGRDATELDAAHVRSAAVESLAENLADGLVAPLTAFALVAGGAGLLTGSGAVPAGTSAVAASTSLPAATGAAAWVKGVNTLDSMLGYPDRPVGTASARLDDAIMWVPARVSAVLLAVAAGSPGSLFDARRWARVPASPNSGWPMATAAAALGVRLSKPGAYTLNPGAALPSLAESRAGVRAVALAGALAFLFAGIAVAGVTTWP